MSKIPVNELIRRALVYAQCDREAYADAHPKGSPERIEASDEAQQLYAYRIKKYGPTKGEDVLSRTRIIDAMTGKYVPRPTRVVNLHKETCEVLIDRSSIYGNPYKIGPDGTRSEVIERYRHWIQLPDQKRLLKTARRELKGKVLGCWCKPRACHGDVLIELIEEKSNANR